MKNKVRLIGIASICFLVFFLMNCKSDDDADMTEEEINIEEAKLSDFPLFGIERTAIDIVNPVIVNNEETTFGKIKITVPGTVASLENVAASITSKELNLSKFRITPGNDELLSFENQKVHIFAISVIATNTEILHYEVSIIREEVIVPETLEITNFAFEKSKNENLPNDVTISRTVAGTTLDKIYLFVPLGTDFTDLVPTITYNGTKLYYAQESNLNSSIEYPDEDAGFDFKYPKPFYLIVEDRNENKRKTTKVIVDVKNPVRLESMSITTSDVTEGSSQYFTGLTRWINQGNHKINFQKATTYEDVSPIVTPAPSTEAITVDRTLPGGGLLPGESADINVRISQYYPEGIYKSTAVFYTRIFEDHDSDDLFEPAKLTVTTKIVK